MNDSETYMNVKFTKTDSPSPPAKTQRTLDRMDDSGTYVKMQLVKPDSPSPPRKTQRTLDKMDDSGTYMKMQLVKPDSQSPSRAEPDVSYAEVNFKTRSEPRVRTDRDGLNSTCSELQLRKEEPSIDEEEDPSISPGPGGLPNTAQTAAQEQESKVKIGNRPCRLICLLCLVTFTLIVTVVGLSIHVSQIRQSDKLMHSDLRHQFTEMETKYRSVNGTKAQICELLTSRKEQTCSEDWITNKDRCYYVSTFQTSLYKAIQECSNRDARLLEINSRDEANFVLKAVHGDGSSYWIGKCKDGKVASNVLFRIIAGELECGGCTREKERQPCEQVKYRYICEKSAPLCPVISEKIQDLCQQPVGPT